MEVARLLFRKKCIICDGYGLSDHYHQPYAGWKSLTPFCVRPHGLGDGLTGVEFEILPE